MSGQSGEKTEPPTDKKIRDARKKGQVAKSQDVSTTWLLIVVFTYFGMTRDFYLENIKEMVLLPSTLYGEPFLDAFATVSAGVVSKFLILVLPMLGLVAFMGIFINFIQVGPLFTIEPLKPDLKKLNPVDGAKKIFAKKNFVELLKSIIKMVFLGYLVYRVIKAVIGPLLLIPFSGLGGIITIMVPIMKMFAINVCAGYVVIAVADLFMQKAFHTKDLMMTKDEVKREFKEMEGDPLIKGERKQLHQELATSDTVQSTKDASALITNPQHYAVAIFYKEGVVDLPVVTAKGADHVALLMKKIAEEEGIPIMRDVNLARALHAQVGNYDYIPTEFIEPVTAVLKWAKETYEGK